MITIQGNPISKGIAFSPVYKIEDVKLEVERGSYCNVKRETEEFHRVRGLAMAEVQAIYEKTLVNLGEEEAKIFEAHLTMLNDVELISQVEACIDSNQCTAAYAIQEVGHQFEMIFSSMDNEYMKERAADIKDITTRMIKHALGVAGDDGEITDACVVLAHDLTPSMTSSFNKDYIQGIITEVGGKTSHSAIIANLLEIPYIVVEDSLNILEHKDEVLFDGEDGMLVISPDSETVNEYEIRRAEYAAKKARYEGLKGKECVTEDGEHMELLANIGRLEDLKPVLESDVKSIGLFRTEFLFMNDDGLPTEEDQYEIYKKVASSLAEGYVTIRTLDIGGDKESPYFDIPKEDNPFLGYRGIRLCLGEVEIFKSQLRAILRASAFGKIKIMFPMIASLEELDKAKALLEQCKNELAEAGTAYDKQIDVGMMIETPAGVIMADVFAHEVDFFSIGTNDLVQYTLAADRMNPKIADLYSAYDPAVIRSVHKVAEAAGEAGIPVSICGESAADVNLLPVWIGLGVTKLSMTASFVPEVKWETKQINSGDALGLSTMVRQKRTKDDVKKVLC